VPQIAIAAPIRPDQGAMLIFGNIGGSRRLALGVKGYFIGARQNIAVGVINIKG